MNNTPMLRLVCPDAHDQSHEDDDTYAPSHSGGAASLLQKSVLRAREHLLASQRVDGSWHERRPVELNIQLDWMLLHIACRQQHPALQRMASRLMDLQLDMGGWSRAGDAEMDIDVSVTAYLLLKLLGHSAGEPIMRQASRAIRSTGGASEVNHDTQRWIDYFARSTSSAAICVNELFTSTPVPVLQTTDEPVSVQSEISQLTGLAVTALLEHGPDAAAAIDALQQLDRSFEVDTDTCSDQLAIEGDSLELTSLAVCCCIASGLPANHVALQSAAAWLMHELTVSRGRHGLAARCHALTSLNALQSTEQMPRACGLPPAMSLLGERSIHKHDGGVQDAFDPGVATALSRALVDEIFSRQQANGGWSEHNRGNDPLMTGLVLQALSGHPDRDSNAAVQKGLALLKDTQQFDGSWVADGADNRVAATASALAGIAATCNDQVRSCQRAASDWLLATALPGGGWCERGRAGQGGADVALTAQAMLALTMAGRADDDAVVDAVEVLLELQRDDGGWDPQDPSGGALQSVSLATLALSQWAARCGKLEVANQIASDRTAKVVKSYPNAPQDCA